MKDYFLYVVSFVILLLISGCNSSTSAQKGTMTGTIQLDGETDHSGIVVSIYSAGIVPTEIFQIQGEYPQLAFPIDDRVLFDHRYFESLQTVYTNQEGRFITGKMPYGQYIVVYRKEGWGYSYCFNVNLNVDELVLSNRDQLKLYPEVALPGMVVGDFILESNKCYLAGSDVVVPLGSRLIIQNNSRLMLAQYVKVIVQGSLVVPDDISRANVTSYAGIHSSGFTENDFADGVQILSDESSVRNLTFSYLGTGLKISGDNLTLDRLAFKSCVLGLVVNSASDIDLSHSLFIDNNNVNAAALYAYDVAGLHATANIYHNNYIAHKHELVEEADLENNAFLSNERGFLNLWESNSSFEYNTVLNCGVGIENSGYSNLTVSYNELECQVGIKTYHTNNWYNTISHGWTKVNYNNLSCSQYAVESRALYNYSEEPYPLDFKSNWWGTTNTSIIENLIVDFNDLGLVGGTGVTSVINYTPFKNSRVIDAGIQ